MLHTTQVAATNGLEVGPLAKGRRVLIDPLIGEGDIRDDVAHVHFERREERSRGEFAARSGREHRTVRIAGRRCDA